MVEAAVETAAQLGVHVAAHAHGAEGSKLAIRAGARSIEHGSLIDDEGIDLLVRHGTWLVADIYDGDWIAEDVKNLLAARARYAKMPDNASRGALMRAAHDIKGQAATFNFPLIARVAGSLSRLIGELPESQPLLLGLVDAHVNAIQVIHRQAIQDTNDKMAQTLCAELDARVEETLKPKT